jgi:PAS domain S-box-containing protein
MQKQGTRSQLNLLSEPEALQAALEIANVGAWGWDELTQEKLWPPQTKAIFGLQPDVEVTRELFVSMLHPDDVQRFEAAWAAALDIEGDHIYQLTYRIRRASDGAERWISSRARVEFVDGMPVRVLGAMRDITDAKETLERLHEGEQRFRITLGNSPVSVAEQDLSLRYTMIFNSQLGYDSASMVGKTDAELLDPGCVAPLQVLKWSVLETGQPMRREVSVARPGGVMGHYDLYVEPRRDAAGMVTGVICVATNVTERKRAEDEMRAAKLELEHLNAGLEERILREVRERRAAQDRLAQTEKLAALGQLAGGVAHDFNNIIQAVTGAASLIGRYADDPVKVRRFAHMMEDAARRGASVTGRLLALARRGELRAGPVDIPGLLDGVREVLTHTLGTTIEVRLDVAGELPPALADRSQLETALVNLAANARDAMQGGGVISISAGVEVVEGGGQLAPGIYIRLGIADTGSGMDEEMLARAMEPFFTTKELGKGTGLGLPMARGFAEQSGGVLTVESAPGRGTKVTLWLPVAEARAAPGPVMPREASAAARHPRIMVVDDEEMVREVLAAGLACQGYEVVQVESANAALARLNAGESFDLLVSDLSMPGMDGVALIRAAQTLRPRLPAVLLTGYAGDAATFAVGQTVNGPVSLLRKPITGVQLADHVAALLAAD